MYQMTEIQSLSTRNLSYDNWVRSTEYGDLVELDDGRWFMVSLGIRGDVERASNMGRETHIMPVVEERAILSGKKKIFVASCSTKNRTSFKRKYYDFKLKITKYN